MAIGRLWEDDEGNIWYQHTPSSRVDLLVPADYVCGVGIFNTGPKDPFRKCCAFHDRGDDYKEWWTSMGYTEAMRDQILFKCMKMRARELKSFSLYLRAHVYYGLVKTYRLIT